MNKVAAWLAVVTIAATSPSVAAGQAGSPIPKRALYDLAVRCFIANVKASGDRKDAGDAAKAAHYDGMAKKSYDGAYVLGDALKFSRAQIDADFQRARREELPAMMRDQAYFYRVVANCKAYGFM
jgi:hypothetical protein